MDKKKVFSESKKFLKELSEKVIKEGKETVKKSFAEKLHDITGSYINDTKQNAKDENNCNKDSEEAIKSNKNEENGTIPNEVYLNEDVFEKNVQSELNKLPIQLYSGDPIEALKVINKLISMAGEVSKFTEIQKTKRKDIEAKRDIIINEIQSQKEILLVYLEKSFDERKDNFSKLFNVVDDAIKNSNMQQLAIGLDSINKLAASSPFKALSDIQSTKNALTDKDHTWDF